MKYIFIMNPAAGKRNGIMRYVDKVQSLCDENELKYAIHISESEDDILDYVNMVCRTEEEALRIYAVGGDGTLSHVVNACVGCENVEIGVIPMGTGNDYVRNFTNETKCFRSIEKQLLARSQKVDVIRVGEKYCINTINVGLDANVGNDMPKYKKMPLVSNKMAYNMSLFNNLCKKLGRGIEIYADGEQVYKGEVALCCVANGTSCGGGFALAPKAEIDDGKVEISYILVPKKIKLPKIFMQVKKRVQFEQEPAKSYVRVVSCKSGRIVLDKESSIGIDGEIQSQQEVEFEVVEGAISFIVPSND